MKKALLLVCLLLVVSTTYAEKRFGRSVVKVQQEKNYTFIKSDDVKYPTLSDGRFSVSCLVYRGTEFYYVEVKVTNNSGNALFLPVSFISFDKPGYTTERIDTMIAARDAAAAGGIRFVPTPPPYVPPTYHTTVDATATTYGNQTDISGTATTTADYSGQAGANLGSAIGNAIAARRFRNAQRIEVAFSHFLADHTQTDEDTALQPGQTRTIVDVFEQMKRKKRPFEIIVRLGTDTFHFDYKG